MATARQQGLSTQVRAALPSASGGARLVVTELEGADPIQVVLGGGASVEVGAEWASELRGETRTPIGSSEGYSAVTGVTLGKTEMQCSWDAAFLRRDDVQTTNANPPQRVEDVLGLFQSLQRRGRECLVQLGPFSRRGVLRSAVATPGKGHALDIYGGASTRGVNLGVKLSWEWAGRLERPRPAEPPASPGDIAGKLGAADAKYGFALGALSELADAVPNAMADLQASVRGVRRQLGNLRKAVRAVGSLVTAPSQVAAGLLAAAKGLGKALHDCEELLGETTDVALAAAGAFGATGLHPGPTPGVLARAGRARGAVRDANADAMDACVAAFDALSRRRARRVPVAPGQLLADVARAQLGAADRWPEIAAANGFAGQVVPPGVTEVALPGGA